MAPRFLLLLSCLHYVARLDQKEQERRLLLLERQALFCCPDLSLYCAKTDRSEGERQIQPKHQLPLLFFPPSLNN